MDASGGSGFSLDSELDRVRDAVLGLGLAAPLPGRYAGSWATAGRGDGIGDTWATVAIDDAYRGDRNSRLAMLSKTRTVTPVINQPPRHRGALDMSLIDAEILPFAAAAYHGGKFVDVTDADLKGKWSVVFFYPADFTSCARRVR